MHSEALGLELHIDGDRLRFFDPVTGTYLETPEERAESAEDRARRAEEAQRRIAVENEALRRQLEESRRRKNGT